jgi:hypothetical protein
MIQITFGGDNCRSGSANNHYIPAFKTLILFITNVLFARSSIANLLHANYSTAFGLLLPVMVYINSTSTICIILLLVW